METVNASETVNQLNANLVKAFVQREDAQASIVEADKAILAIRNVLAGVQVGQKLQTEVLAETAAAAAKEHEAKIAADVERSRKARQEKEGITVLHK